MAQKTKNLNLPPKSRKIYSDINAGSASTSRDDSQTSFHFETLTEEEKKKNRHKPSVYCQRPGSSQ